MCAGLLTAHTDAFGLKPQLAVHAASVAACYALMAASQRHAGTAVYVFAFAYLLVWCAPQACEQSFSPGC